MQMNVGKCEALSERDWIVGMNSCVMVIPSLVQRVSVHHKRPVIRARSLDFLELLEL